MEQKLTLEQANDLLDQTIKQLQSPSLPLSESVELYGRACELLAYCMKELETYKGKINQINEKLSKDIAEGNL